MGEKWDDADLGEMHVVATYAHHAGYTCVEIAPMHVVDLIDQLKRARADLAEERAEHRATATEFRRTRECLYAVSDWRHRVDDRDDLAELDDILGKAP